MAIVGNDGVVRVSTQASPVTWTPGGAAPTGGLNIGEIRSYSVESTADTIETSVMGNDTRQYVKGMSTWSGTADVLFVASEFTAINPAGSGTVVGSLPVFMIFYPQGLTAAPTDPVIGGAVVITGYTVNASYDGLIEASISFQGSGPLFYQANA